MADRYIDAHNVKTGQTKSAKPQNRPWKENKATSAKHNKSEAKELQSATKPRFMCFLCDKPGHKAIDCKLKQKIKMAAASVLDGNSDSENSDIASCLEILEKHHEKAKRSPTYIGLTFPTEDKKDQKHLPVEKGFVNRQPVQVLRDTGCTGIIIKRSLITEKQLTGKQVTYTTVDGTRNTVPKAEIHIETPFYTGIVRAICMNDPVYDLIIGNIKEVIKQPTDIRHSYEHSKEEIQIAKEKNGKFTTAAPVTTRAQTVQSQTKQKSKPLNVPQLPQVGNFEEFKKEQQDDPNLQILWDKMKDEIITKRKTLRYKFILHDQLLYRQVLKRESEEELFEKQLVVPAKYRTLVLQTAHDTLLSGHLGITKTLARVKCHFFWVGMDMDVTRYCRSCDICQKTVPKGQLKKGKLENMPIITVPFQRVAVDIIGPLFPTSKRGKKYILTMVDVATRYPQAAALSIIDSETVAEALISMFSNCGIPNEILTDRGTQFTSKMMQEVHRLLSIKSVTTTPYHAQCNGLCEKYNGTLKAMLKRMIGEQPIEWDRFLEPLLFAYREAPISSLGGFSPFEVLYGRSVRGPTTVLREVWANENLADEEKTVYEYVLDLRNRLEETCKITRKELENAQQKMKVRFDRKAGD